MRRRNGLSLAELLVVLATLAMLAALLVPSLGAARRSSRLSACGVSLNRIHNGLLAHANANRMRMPPFAYSGTAGHLPLSEHWGGVDQPTDPDGLFRKGVDAVNLSYLCRSNELSQASLVCPAAELGDASLFPRTRRFSTYALRFPYSSDVFDETPKLANLGGQLLGVYLQAAGGQQYRWGSRYYDVPLVRMDRRYTLDIDCSVFDPLAGAIAADGFFFQQQSVPAGAPAHAVRRQWSHGGQFNVLMGSGAVQLVVDDGGIAADTVPPGGSIADDGKTFATHLQRVWQHFEKRPPPPP